MVTESKLDESAADGTDKGTAYYRPQPSHNARLTEVGRGTPMGELMRRYWQPIGLASYASDLPRKIRALGEDLILFRDGQGRPGLVYPRCCHRGASLFYGAVEAEGIRCCYHGWLFDCEGNCLERPAEPVRGPVRSERVRQPWYPLAERYGLIWAFMGPAERKPLLPRYDTFEEMDDGELLYTDDNNIGSGEWAVEVPFNWLQHFENIHDVAHFYWLHYLHSGPQFGTRFGEIDLPAMRRDLNTLVKAPQYEVNERGLTARRRQLLPDGRILENVVETVLPSLRVVPNPFGKAGRADHVGFILPVDDTHFKTFTVLRAADRSFLDYFVNKRAEDSTKSAEETQRHPGDYQAQGSQGPITLHSEERLATSDRAIVMLRRLFDEQIKVVEGGGNPIGVHFVEGTQYVRLAAGAFISATPETA